GSGNLYGTTNQDGANGEGTVFMLTPGSGAFKVLASLTPATGSTLAGVVRDNSGNLFGVTQGNSVTNFGTMFEVAAGSSVVTPLATFSPATGTVPVAALVRDSSGNLYGTTTQDGAGGSGTVFMLAAGSHTPTVLASFNGANGGGPRDLIMDGGG